MTHALISESTIIYSCKKNGLECRKMATRIYHVGTNERKISLEVKYWRKTCNDLVGCHFFLQKSIQ